jgi:hypothetical protein
LTSDDATGSPLNPWAWLVALTHSDLPAAEAKWLQGAILATDNPSRKVRMSIEGVAEKANVSRKTGTRAVKTGEERGYFARVSRYRDKQGRSVTDIWFKPAPPHEGQEVPRDKKSPVNEGQDEGQEVPPSTTSTPIGTTSFPCFTCGLVECLCDEEAQDSTSLREDAQAAAVNEVEATEAMTVPEIALCVDHGNVYPKDGCPHCFAVAGRERSESKHSDEQRRQWFENNLEQNEDPKALGIDPDEIAPNGYVPRRRR